MKKLIGYQLSEFTKRLPSGQNLMDSAYQEGYDFFTDLFEREGRHDIKKFNEHWEGLTGEELVESVKKENVRGITFPSEATFSLISCFDYYAKNAKNQDAQDLHDDFVYRLAQGMADGFNEIAEMLWINGLSKVA